MSNEQILELFRNIKSEMNIKKQIDLKICPVIGSPMLFGLFAPRILLPKTDLAKDDLSFILKHELVHCKRKDLLYKWFMLTATAIHWFNPVIH